MQFCHYYVKDFHPLSNLEKLQLRCLTAERVSPVEKSTEEHSEGVHHEGIYFG